MVCHICIYISPDKTLKKLMLHLRLHRGRVLVTHLTFKEGLLWVAHSAQSGAGNPELEDAVGH